MNDERKGPVGRGSPDIEGGLGRLAAAPVPPGLQRRVIDRALEARRNVALTPRLRTLAFVCATVILAVLVTDPVVGRHDEARLAALLGVPEATELVVQDSELLWAELGVSFEDIARAMRKGIGISGSTGRTVTRKDLREARDWLKGIAEHEDPESIF